MQPFLVQLRLAFLSSVCFTGLPAHVATPVTHSFDRGVAQPGPRLVVSIHDASTGEFLAARFSVAVDGKPYQPEWIDEQGIRFSSKHHSKQEYFTALYSRGQGPVTTSLPVGCRSVEVTATRGFEYMPATASGQMEQERASLSVGLDRWTDLTAEGWITLDEHLHYDRLASTADEIWLTMLEADGLTAGHFMTLKGGMVPGVWARQFAYGAHGRATDGNRLIVPGEEYRDPAMGHINLLGVGRLIQPISTGGYGVPPTPWNFPPLHDVLLEARAAGALTGVAHGATLGRQPTAVADAILGAVDFWEVSNGFIYSTETWYRLMNCGFFLPPAAGTDLPNSPFRDPWQPMLGAVRTYVHTGGAVDFASFKAAMAKGRVFITGGPIISLTVNGKSAGETVMLPPGGGTVTIKAELASTRPLHELRLVHNGREIPAAVRKGAEGGAQRRSIEHRLRFDASGWIAAWGRGDRIVAQDIDAIAHTGAVRVLVGDEPVRSEDDLRHFIDLLTRQRDYYRTEARYESEADRLHAIRIFDRAMEKLKSRLAREVQPVL